MSKLDNLKEKALQNLSDDSKIIVYNIGDWNENSYSLSKDTLYYPTGCYDAGTILIRFNKERKNLRCHVMSGEKNSFYDASFGAGSITHYGINVEINEFMTQLYNNHKKLWIRMAKLIEEKIGIVLYEKVTKKQLEEKELRNREYQKMIDFNRLKDINNIKVLDEYYIDWDGYTKVRIIDTNNGNVFYKRVDANGNVSENDEDAMLDELFYFKQAIIL